MSVPEYLSISKLSKLTKRDRRTVSERLADLPTSDVGGAGKVYYVPDALPLIYATESSKGNQKKKEHEELRYERARADKMEIEVAKRKGELIEIESVAEVVEQEYTAVAAGIRAIPTKLAMSVAHREPHEVKTLLEEAINEVLIELSAAKKYEIIGEELEGESGKETSPKSSEDPSSETES